MTKYMHTVCTVGIELIILQINKEMVTRNVSQSHIKVQVS